MNARKSIVSLDHLSTATVLADSRQTCDVAALLLASASLPVPNYSVRDPAMSRTSSPRAEQLGQDLLEMVHRHHVTSPGTRCRTARGIAAAYRFACVTGTVTSASPCHTCTGTVMSSSRKPQS